MEKFEPKARKSRRTPKKLLSLMNRQTRRINDYVSGVDLVKCSRQLLDNLRAAQEKTGVPYNEIAETTEIPLERLEGLLHSDQPHLYREEVIRVALVTGTAL